MSAQQLFRNAAEIDILDWFSDIRTIHMRHNSVSQGTSVSCSSEGVKTDKPHRDQQMEKR